MRKFSFFLNILLIFPCYPKLLEGSCSGIAFVLEKKKDPDNKWYSYYLNIQCGSTCLLFCRKRKKEITAMSRVSLLRTISHIGPLQVAIIILAVATALVHLDRGLMMSLFAPHFAGGPGPSAGHFTGGHPPSTGHLAGGPSPSGSSILRMLPLTQLFFLNFLGYIVLVTALYLPLLRRYQRIIRWLLIAYTATTILAWFIITNASPNLLAYIDKPIEVALIILLLIEDRQTRLVRG